jgi:hypothetical protein
MGHDPQNRETQSRLGRFLQNLYCSTADSFDFSCPPIPDFPCKEDHGLTPPEFSPPAPPPRFS